MSARMRWYILPLMALSVFVLFSGSASRTGAQEAGQQTPEDQLAEKLREDGVSVKRHSETGEVRFVGASKADPISRPEGLSADAPTEAAARAHLAGLEQLFGIGDQARELRAEKSEDVGQGRSITEFQQVYKGVPVLGGEINTQVNGANELLAATGEVSPNISLDAEPGISADEAGEVAAGKISRDRSLETGEIQTTEPALWIYDPALLGAPGPQATRLVWRLEVSPEGNLDEFRELVLVDAETGGILLNFDQVAHGQNRKTYTANNTNALPGTLLCSETTNPCAPGNTDAQKTHTHVGDVYNFYRTNHGRDGIDGAGMTITSTVDYCSDNDSNGAFECPYRNGFWDGTQIALGAGMTSDDWLGHELTHGVTQYESGLFYYQQSGAINESFSDIWGEFVDLTNGRGNDGPEMRWIIFEDGAPLRAERPDGRARDMQDPPSVVVSGLGHGSPDRMLSPNYFSDPNEVDQGGVHINSGVNNKAAYLMTDGDTFNGKTVTGLGITKVAKIYYEAQTNLLTSGSDYQDLHSALQQACQNLTGTAGITSADCVAVKDAVDATEMHLTPTAAPNPEAPVCPTGQQPTNLFSDDMERGAANTNWTRMTGSGANSWQSVNGFATSGAWSLYGENQAAIADYSFAKATGVAVPTSKTTYLRFDHSYGFDDGTPVNGDAGSYYDGGLLEYSTNNGSTWQDAGSLITNNGYNGAIDANYDNPLKGRQGFVGESNGYISSRVDLSSLAGQSVRFRFRIGTDSFYGDYGWFVDDVRVYTCGDGAPPQGPTNDDFARPHDLVGTSATVVGSNINGTAEAGEPNHAGSVGGKSVWYRWTPQASGTATVDTAGSGFDTLLGVYTGGAVNGLSQVASNDDAAVGVRTSRVSFPASAGTTYRIAVDGFFGASGGITLDLSQNVTQPDTKAPTVKSSSPSPNKRGVSRKASIKATFSETMNKSTLNYINVQIYKNGKGNPLGASVKPSSDGRSVTLNPSARRLEASKAYLVVLWRDANGIKDAANPGNRLAASGKYKKSPNGEFVYFWFKTGRR